MDIGLVGGIIGKVLVLVTGAFAVFKAYNSLHVRRRSQLRRDYKFLKQFINTVQAQPRPHDLVIENGYLALSGKSLPAAEILHLLTYKNPSLALKNYAEGRRFLMLGPDGLCYREGYAEEKARKRYRAKRLFWYAVTGLFAFFPLMFVGALYESTGPEAILVALAFLVSFGLIALLTIWEYGAMVGAEVIMNDLRPSEGAVAARPAVDEPLQAAQGKSKE